MKLYQIHLPTPSSTNSTFYACYSLTSTLPGQPHFLFQNQNHKENTHSKTEVTGCSVVSTKRKYIHLDYILKQKCNVFTALTRLHLLPIWHRLLINLKSKNSQNRQTDMKFQLRATTKQTALDNHTQWHQSLFIVGGATNGAKGAGFAYMYKPNWGLGLRILTIITQIFRIDDEGNSDFKNLRNNNKTNWDVILQSKAKLNRFKLNQQRMLSNRSNSDLTVDIYDGRFHYSVPMMDLNHYG
jgi:hypothetical protein